MVQSLPGSNPGVVPYFVMSELVALWQRRGTQILEEIRIANKLKPRSAHRFQNWEMRVLIGLLCMPCVISSASTSKLFPPSEAEAGGLRLTQVVGVASREEILKSGETLQHLLASGLKDVDLRDGSVAVGRIYCCHQWTENGTNILFYVPPNVSLKIGDLVSVRMGRKSTKREGGTVNMAVEVREKKDDPISQCSWNPPDDKMWTRILYCSWMPAEGWTLQKGLHKTWLKPASEAKAEPR
jgi:hypothetical protein